MVVILIIMIKVIGPVPEHYLLNSPGILISSDARSIIEGGGEEKTKKGKIPSVRLTLALFLHGYHAKKKHHTVATMQAAAAAPCMFPNTWVGSVPRSRGARSRTRCTPDHLQEYWVGIFRDCRSTRCPRYTETA